MKAIWYERMGPAAQVLIHGEMPIPAPGPNEVLVRLHASGVNPSDVKARAGTRLGGPGMPWPRIIPHSDGAGVIEAVGKGVSRRRVGQRVWIWNGQWRRPYGTAADYIALPQEQAVWLPDMTDFVAGACLGIPATTAHRCVFADGPVAGQTILVTGGAGSVSQYAIQMAKLGGATVISTVSTDDKAHLARAAGADHVVNYRAPGAIAAVQDLTSGAGVDRIVDVEFGANIPMTVSVLKEQGIIAAYGSASAPAPVLPFYPLMFKTVTLHMILTYLLPLPARSQACADITAWLMKNQLRHAIAATVPLSQTIDAHAVVESGTKLGTVVVTMD